MEKVFVVMLVSLWKVRDLEERLVEKEHELKQMKRNLDESEGAIAQVTLVSTIGLCLGSRTAGTDREARLRRCLRGSSVCGRRRWRS